LFVLYVEDAFDFDGGGHVLVVEVWVVYVHGPRVHSSNLVHVMDTHAPNTLVACLGRN